MEKKYFVKVSEIVAILPIARFFPLVDYIYKNQVFFEFDAFYTYLLNNWISRMDRRYSSRIGRLRKAKEALLEAGYYFTVIGSRPVALFLYEQVGEAMELVKRDVLCPYRKVRRKKMVRTHVYMAEELFVFMDELCREMGCSRSHIIEAALRDYFEVKIEDRKRAGVGGDEA